MPIGHDCLAILSAKIATSKTSRLGIVIEICMARARLEDRTWFPAAAHAKRTIMIINVAHYCAFFLLKCSNESE